MLTLCSMVLSKLELKLFFSVSELHVWNEAQTIRDILPWKSFSCRFLSLAKRRQHLIIDDVSLYMQAVVCFSVSVCRWFSTTSFCIKKKQSRTACSEQDCFRFKAGWRKQQRRAACTRQIFNNEPQGNTRQLQGKNRHLYFYAFVLFWDFYTQTLIYMR